MNAVNLVSVGIGIAGFVVGLLGWVEGRKSRGARTRGEVACRSGAESDLLPHPPPGLLAARESDYARPGILGQRSEDDGPCDRNRPQGERQAVWVDASTNPPFS